MTTISIEQRTWLTTEEAAEYLRISTKTLLRAIKNMQLKICNSHMDMNRPKRIPDRREVNSYFIEQD